jgi:menaquinone-specific isochorismate synthase
VTTPQSSPLIWAHEGRALLGRGEVRTFDPGTGPDRYEKALVALRESGMPVGYASFTFDPEREGSIVMVPEQVVDIQVDELASSIDPIPKGTIDTDGSDSWMSGISRAMDALQEGTLEKVVLSRQVETRFESDVPTQTVISRLHAAQPTCYTFSVDGLIGASPELLVSFTDGYITSLALAGTAIAEDGLQSQKIEREHRYTASSVESALAHHVSDLTKKSSRVLSFGDIKHLASRFEGQAVAGTSVLSVLASLHPTAAVAGTPKDLAISLIRQIEPTGRGRYAGPVGWFNTDGEGEFAIALRCGLIRGRDVTLYAGGGIVVGSDANTEFDETELKLQPMRRALEL